MLLFFPKNNLSNFEPFGGEAFFETPQQSKETFREKFRCFLNYIEGFQNVYGYWGLKSQTKKGVGCTPPP